MEMYLLSSIVTIFAADNFSSVWLKAIENDIYKVSTRFDHISSFRSAILRNCARGFSLTQVLMEICDLQKMKKVDISKK